MPDTVRGGLALIMHSLGQRGQHNRHRRLQRRRHLAVFQ